MSFNKGNCLRAFMAIAIIFLSTIEAMADEGKILFHSFEEDAPWVYSINPDGSGLKKIIKNGLYPVWSPDRKMFAYLTQINDKKRDMNVAIASTDGKVLYTVESQQVELRPGKYEKDLPAYYEWSPDGKKLVMVSNVMRTVYVRVFDTDTRQVVTLHSTPFHHFDEAQLWSMATWVDSENILFSHGSPEKPVDRMRLINLKTGAKEDFNNADKQTDFYFDKYDDKIIAVEVSKPDTIIYLRRGANSYQQIMQLKGVFVPISKVCKGKLMLGRFQHMQGQIILVDLETKTSRQLALAKGYAMLAPVFSPDGTRVIFTIVKGEGDGDRSREEGYYIYDISSNRLTLLKSFFKERQGNGLMAMHFGQKIKEYSWR